MKTNEPQTGISVDIREPGEGQMVLSLAGRLDSGTLLDAWSRSVEPVGRAQPRHLTVDAAELTYCDGAGLGLFAELRRIVAAADGQVEFTGLTGDLERLLEMSLLDDPLAGELQPPPKVGMVTYIGKASWLLLRDIHQIITFVGELTAGLFWAIFHPSRVRGREVVAITERAGADAVPVVALLGLLMGLILAFQTAEPLGRYGAEPLIPTLVSIASLREMSALITAVILAGRSGAAFAAEIGTMKVTEELSALRTMGIEPMQFLVIPRVLAALMVMPLLTVLNFAMSLVGGFIVMASMGYSLSFYVNQVTSAVTVRDFLGGTFKSLVFALIVAGVGCLRGTQTQSGPGAVGDSTTRAVVAGIVLTIVADAVLGVVYYNLGI